MTEYSGITIIDLDPLGSPSALRSFQEGDTIASAVLPENVRNAASGFDAASANLKQDIDGLSSTTDTISATVDSLSLGTVTIPNSVSAGWEAAANYTLDNSANIAEASVGFNNFSGNVETSTATINDNVVAGAAAIAANDVDISNLTTSSSELSGAIDINAAELAALRVSSTELSTAIDNVGGGGGGTIDSSVSSVWEDGATYIADTSSDIIEVSAGFGTFSGNVETSTATQQTAIDAGVVSVATLTTHDTELSGFIDQVSGVVDTDRSNSNATDTELSGFIDQVSGAVGSGGTGVVELSGFVDQVSGVVDDNKTESDTETTELSGFVDQVSGSVDGVSGLLDTSVATVNSSLSALDSDITANTVEINSVTGTSIPNLQSQISSNDGDIVNINASATELSGFVDQVSGVVDADRTGANTSSTELSGFIDQVSGAVDAEDASLQAQIDDIISDMGEATVESSVSGNWQNAYTGWSAASANAIAGSDGFTEAESDIIEVSSGFSTFSGNVETSVATLDSEIDSNDTDITNLTTSSSELSGHIEEVYTSLAGGYSSAKTHALYYTGSNPTDKTTSLAALPHEELVRVVSTDEVRIWNSTDDVSATLNVSGEVNACSIHVTDIIECEDQIIASGCPYPPPFSFIQLSSTGTLLLSGTWYSISNGASAVNATYAEDPIVHECASSMGASWDYEGRQWNINADGYYEVEANINHFWQVATSDSLLTHSFQILQDGTEVWNYLNHPQLTQTESREAISFKIVLMCSDGETVRVQCQNNGNNATLIGGPADGSTVKITRIG